MTYQYAKPSTIDTPIQGQLIGAKASRDAAFKRVKAIREAIRNSGVRVGNLRLELIKAESSHRDLVSLVRSCERGIEQRANELGLTTIRSKGN